MSETIEKNMHHSLTEDLSEALFVPGIVTSAIIELVSYFSIASVNEWLQFGVLLVTFVAGILRIIYMIKRKDSK